MLEDIFAPIPAGDAAAVQAAIRSSTAVPFRTGYTTQAKWWAVVMDDIFTEKIVARLATFSGPDAEENCRIFCAARELARRAQAVVAAFDAGVTVNKAPAMTLGVARAIHEMEETLTGMQPQPEPEDDEPETRTEIARDR